MTKEKYKTLLVSLFIISLFCFSVANAKVVEELPLFGKIIFVDAGHGGRDPGTMYGKIMEKDINLEISQKLQDTLMEKGAIVYMTRDSDEDLSSEWDPKKKRGDLYRRIVMFRKKQADLYLSIHINWHAQAGIKGPEVLYNNINKENKYLGEILMDHFESSLNTKRVLKTTDLYMYRNTTVPGVLIECGYLSNYQERQLLQSDTYQQKLADIITDATIDFFQTRHQKITNENES